MFVPGPITAAALLLAFSFSLSMERFVERQELIATEANAIGTSWLRADLLDEVEALHARIWRAAADGVLRKPEHALVVLTPVNDVIDLHSLRVAATIKHLPVLVLVLLIVSSLVAVSVIGYGCGMDGRRRWLLTSSLAVLITAALWITIDLDRPRQGFLQLDDAPLKALKFG